MADGGREGVYGHAYFMKSKILCKRKVYKQDKKGRNDQSPLKTIKVISKNFCYSP